MVCTTAVAHLNSDQVASRRRSFFFGVGSQKHQGIAGGVEVMCKSEMFCIAVHAPWTAEWPKLQRSQVPIGASIIDGLKAFTQALTVAMPIERLKQNVRPGTAIP